MTAQKRAKLNKQTRRALIKAGDIPAVIYGRGFENYAVRMRLSEFEKVLLSAGYSSMVDLAVDDGNPIKVLIQDVAYHPMTEKPIHADFLQLRMDEEIEAEAEIKFIGKLPKAAEAGVLVKNITELPIRCLPGKLVREIDVDLSALKNIHDCIRVSDLKLPEGIEALREPADIIATVIERKEEVVAVAAPVTAQEPEVIKKGKKEEEGAEPKAEAAKGPAVKEEKSKKK